MTSRYDCSNCGYPHYPATEGAMVLCSACAKMTRPCRHDAVDQAVAALVAGTLHAGDTQAIDCLAELRSADDLRYAIRAAGEAVCSTTGAERLGLAAWHDRAVERRNGLLGIMLRPGCTATEAIRETAALMLEASKPRVFPPGKARWPSTEEQQRVFSVRGSAPTPEQFTLETPHGTIRLIADPSMRPSDPPIMIGRQPWPYGDNPPTLGQTHHPDGTVTLDQLASDGRGGLYVKREGDRGEPKTTYELALEHSVRVKQQRIEELEANNAALRRLADGRSELEKSYQEITRDNTLVRAQAVRLRCELEQLRERFAALPGPKRGGVEIACQNDEEEP